MELRDSTLDAVEKINRVFGKESRIITTTSTTKASSVDGQKKLF
jgi:hypothetical protein